MTTKTKYIPDGYHTLTPYLVVRGASKALEFYAKAFGAQELFRMPGPDGSSVMHAEMKIGDSIVMLSDESPAMGSSAPETVGGTSTSIHVYVPDVDAAVARAVKAGAKVLLAPADMFWGDRFGKVQDPFGHTWSIATHVRDVAPEEMARAMQAASTTTGKK